MLKKPVNPHRFLTDPALPELIVLCVTRGSKKKKEKYVFEDNASWHLLTLFLLTVYADNGSVPYGVFPLYGVTDTERFPSQYRTVPCAFQSPALPA